MITRLMKNSRLGRAIAAFMLVAVPLGYASPTVAEEWPARPVTIVTPFAAGSITDAMARVLSQHLQQTFGKPFVIENKPGAGGLLAAQAVARAQPDGYTLLVTTSSTHSAAPSLFKSVPYDPIADFTPIARLGSFPSVVVVNPETPIKTIQDLVAYTKAKPGELSYGYGNSTGLIVGESLRKRVAVDMVKVSYRSNPAAVTDLIAGHIKVMVPDFTNALPQIADQKMRPLAVLTKERSANLPDVPTLDETVLPGFDLLAWAGIFGPAKMPDEIVRKLAAGIQAALANPQNLQKLKNAGIEPFYSGPDEFKPYVAVELAKWTKVIKEADIQPE